MVCFWESLFKCCSWREWRS